MKRQDFNNYLDSANFIHLFNELGWDRAGSGYDVAMTIDEKDYALKSVAQKRGFMVYTCLIETIPPNSFFKKSDIRLRKYSNDYLLIFVEQNTAAHHLWLAPVKTVEKRDLVTIEYATTAQTDFLFSKLPNLSFTLDEEVTIVDVTSRIHSAFEINSAKITKDFYSGFKRQHSSFSSFIRGIDMEGDKQWYVSIMLNRLMFCYFIQKKGFLNFDPDYLRHKLEWTQEQQGNNQFFGTFYKGFLRALFHCGLNSPKHDIAFEQKYGRIPYLNGGLFDEHILEKQYAGIDIDDKAFEDLFDFFDKWRWHLDTRITASGKDINPDVLGYIFEQYINDRAQMGAYYTKEDITEYIGKNCILPFLMDEVAKTASKTHFEPNGFVWQILRESGQRYIYHAVRKGYGKPLPKAIARGIDTQQPNLLERRSEWNKPASSEFALPTEIWRETVERLQRCEAVTRKIADGEIMHINDLITYNLDIRSFIFDLLSDEKTDHLFIKHFYGALQRITILDPTCGSGAFLFAALNVLEPLYEICIDRMEAFNRQNPQLFKNELAEIEEKYRSNIQYYIYKSIILRNLYGVDIMAEATEIAKLRLFLKMVAVVDVDRRAGNLGLDPLPDIDFNIRCGNTLVGFASFDDAVSAINAKDKTGQMGFIFDDELDIVNAIKNKADDLAIVFRSFKQAQLDDDLTVFKQAKNKLMRYQADLNEILNEYLAFTYGIDNAKQSDKYHQFLASHQPFHWFAEFYEIIHGNGGFDVIIGNPPYVEYSKVKDTYILSNYKSIESGNLYAFVIERCLAIMKPKSRIGMIIQMSAFCTPRMASFQKVWFNVSANSFVSFFDDRPGKLFDGLEHIRVAICMSEFGKGNKEIGTTNYIKFRTEFRPVLFENIHYETSNNSLKDSSLLKVNSIFEKSIINKLWANKGKLLYYLTEKRNDNFVYYGYGYGYFGKILNYQSYFKGEKVQTSTGDKFIYCNSDYDRDVIVALMNSSLFYWFYVNYSDGHNFTKFVIGSIPFDYPISEIQIQLKQLTNELMIDLKSNSSRKTAFYKATGTVEYDEYFPKLSKSIIDEIDAVLAEHYGFTEEELDFIINYDIKYRMGKELNEEEE